MDELFDVLRAGTAPGSPPAARQAAAAVCHAFLIALEATPGQPLLRFPTPPAPTAAGTAPASTSLSDIPLNEEDNGVLDEDTQGAAPSESEAGTAMEDEPDEDLLLDGATMESHSSPKVDTQLCDAAEARQHMEGAAPVFTSPPTARINAEAIATLARSVQSLPMEQVLDLAITQMRTLLREKGEPVPTAPRAGVRFRLVPIPQDARTFGGSRAGNTGM